MVSLLLLDALVIWIRLDRVGADLAGSAAGGTTFLLIGSDQRVDVPKAERSRFGSSRDVPGERADVLLLVRVTDSGSVRVLGIPRDLVLYRRSSGADRVTAMLRDGPGAIADAICNSLGIGIGRVAVLHFAGLRDLVDLAGGVTVQSDEIVFDRNSGLLLQKGTNRLDGSRALAYVRARHMEIYRDGDAEPDLLRSAQRPQRATEVLRGVGSKLSVRWTDPIATQQLAWTTAGALTVDGGTGPWDLLGLADTLGRLPAGEPPTLPVIHRSDDPPIDELSDDAWAMVDQFQGSGSRPAACRRPALRPPT